MNSSKNILIAPLNWGLGHATRCIPIINKLIEHGFTPIIASDGRALELLKKEFPHCVFESLPGYEVTYAREAKHFKLNMLLQIPKLIKAVISEYRTTQKLHRHYQFCGVISDNRLGVRLSKIPSVFITHQTKVMSGGTTYISTKIHRFFIHRFHRCWIPDMPSIPNLSGRLGHSEKLRIPVDYLGVISRFQKSDTPLTYDLCILLSGPEPQRTMLENQLKSEIVKYTFNTLFIRGVVEKEQKTEKLGFVIYYNFMTSVELEQALNASKFILSRSGYTTVLDLAALEKQAYFIPTPGQYEQEYLAKKLKKDGIVPYAKQHRFSFEKMWNEIKLYDGLRHFKHNTDWSSLFGIFQ